MGNEDCDSDNRLIGVGYGNCDDFFIDIDDCESDSILVGVDSRRLRK